MKRSKFDLDRRTFIKASGVTLALPMLEAMIPTMLRAQAMPKPILINWVWPNGFPLHYKDSHSSYGPNWSTHVAQWLLDHYSQGLTPKLRSASSVVDNSLHNWTSGFGGGHFANSFGLYMGSKGKYKNLDHLYNAPGNGEDLMTETYDQRIARHFGIKPNETLNVGLTQASRSDRPINSLSWYRDGSLHRPVYLDTLPNKLFDRITGGVNNSNADKEIRRKALLEKNSLLSLVMDQTKALKSRLGMEDRARVDEYLTGIEEAEKKVTGEVNNLASNTGTQSCSKQGMARPKDYVYKESISSQSEYMEKMQIYIDLMTLSMECGQHSVFGVIGGGAGNYGFRLNGLSWHPVSHYIANLALNSPEHKRYRKTFGDFAKLQVDFFTSWMKRLSEIKQPDGSVLFDRVFATCTSYLGEAGHGVRGIPTMMMGTGGGRIPLHNGHVFKAPKVSNIRTSGIPQANIWLSAMKQMGIQENKFGMSTGTLPEFGKAHS